MGMVPNMESKPDSTTVQTSCQVCLCDLPVAEPVAAIIEKPVAERTKADVHEEQSDLDFDVSTLPAPPSHPLSVSDLICWYSLEDSKLADRLQLLKSTASIRNIQDDYPEEMSCFTKLMELSHVDDDDWQNQMGQDILSLTGSDILSLTGSDIYDGCTDDVDDGAAGDVDEAATSGWWMNPFFSGIKNIAAWSWSRASIMEKRYSMPKIARRSMPLIEKKCSLPSLWFQSLMTWRQQ